MPRILIVEDEGAISEPFAIILRTKDHTVDLATNGFEALELCRQHSYDLILLDIMMPICDGNEFLKRAKLHETSPKTVVFVLTNLAMGADIIEALSLGAARSLLKSNITPTMLIDLVEEALAPATQE